MAELNDLDIVAANNNFAPASGGWPEGMTVASVNNAAREDLAIIARGYRDQRGSLVSGGAADAQTLTTNAAHAAYFNGMTFTFRAGFSNTGACTLNVNGIAARNIYKANPAGGTMTTLDGGDITAGGVYRVVYDSTNTRFVLLNPGNLLRTNQILTSATAYSLASTNHPLQLGLATGLNVAMDRTGMQGRNNGAASPLELQRSGSYATVGDPAAAHVEYGPAGVQGRNGAAVATLPINGAGGTTAMGGSATVAGSLAVSGNMSAVGTITATNTINANNGISADGAIVTSGGNSIDSGQDLVATNDVIAGNDLTVMNDASVAGDTTLTGTLDVTGDTTLGDMSATEVHGPMRYSAVTGSTTLTAAQLNGLVVNTSGVNTITLPDTAADVPLGSWVDIANANGAADITIAATSTDGDTSIAHRETARFVMIATNTWSRVRSS